MRFRPTTPLLARRGDQRGQVLVLFTLTLVVLLLISALAVDYGGWLVTRRSYQNVADAAALAGAQQLTRPLGPTDYCIGTTSKQQCARQAAWQSVKSALGLTILDPVSQAAASSTKDTAYTENGYSIWVASPPAEANAGCASGCPFPGHVSGPGDVFVKVEHPGAHYLSRVLFANDVPVTAWATAGRFPENFAVIGLCNPDTGNHCLTGQGTPIKVDGGSYLAVETGDLGTNGWTKTDGNNAAIGLGPDSNAYMQNFDTCWQYPTNQCQLIGYDSGAFNSSDTRSAVPLGAPVTDPLYPAPTLSDTATPYQCYSFGTQSVSMVETSPIAVAPVDLSDILQPAAQLVAATPPPVGLAATTTASGQVKNYWTGAGVNGLTVAFATLGSATTATVGGKAGAYSIANATKGANYNVTVSSGATTIWGPNSTNVPNSGNVSDILILPYAQVDGYVRDASTNAGIPNATVTIAAGGSANAAPQQTATTDGSGHYLFSKVEAFDRSVSVSAAGYTSPAPKAVTVAMITGATSPTTDFTMSKTVTGSIQATVRDATTNLPLSGVPVSAKNGGTTLSGTTDSSGSYTFSNLALNVTWTVSASATSYFTTSAPASPSASLQLSSATPQQVSLTLWPQQCNTSRSSGTGSWSCNSPCGTVQNEGGTNVTCSVFDASNAIRPGTYTNIDIKGCAWIDPKGGSEGLTSGQSPGIVYVTGTLQLEKDSYLFGDGVTIVMGSSAAFNTKSSAGFVLNYGTTDATFATAYDFGAAGTPCFRTVAGNCDGNDYAYAAWTTKGHNPWACSGTASSPPVYSTAAPCVTVGSDLGITWYLKTGSQFTPDGNSFGYQFNGVLYGPQVDVSMGGGKDGQSAAGQIVGWTIEYHGGTHIVQRWYGDPVDGPPFLVEPILGECFAPVASC